jgi:hypothetical protein
MKRILILACLLLCASAATTYAQEAISDNSFLVEEAYNQEAGVVQHINTFQRMRGGDWAYTFTQEWPFLSERHQLSYTIPGLGFGAGEKGFGDVALNYRYQLVANKRFGVSPRLSLLLPTGSVSKGMGTGGAGLQFNLPVSIVHSKRFVTHWNAGTTFTFRAKDDQGNHATTTGYNLGQSVVWLAQTRFNVLFETAWSSSESVTGPQSKTRSNNLFINPGVRWSYNFRSGLQIVPGVAVPIGIGPSNGQRGFFFYLSFEHPFKKERG